MAQQSEALRVGVEAERRAVELANAVGDMPLAAFLNRALASGLSTGSDPEGAAKASREAEGVYRELAARRPDTYRPHLAMTLNNPEHRLACPG